MLVDSFHVMSCLYHYLIEPCMEKLILNHFFLEKLSRVLQWTSGQLFFQNDFRKWLFGTLFLDSHFENLPDSVILQKYQSLEKQSFKHNLRHMPYLNITPKFYFAPRFRLFIINGYYTKRNSRALVLGLLVTFTFTLGKIINLLEWFLSPLFF